MTRDFARAHSGERHPMMSTSHQRHFGAIPTDDGVRFCAFAPPGCDLRLHLLTGRASGAHLPLSRDSGVFEFSFLTPRGRSGMPLRWADRRFGRTRDAIPAGRRMAPGDRRSRHLPLCHVTGVAARDLVIHELHVGTFTLSGTFAGVRGQLGAPRSRRHRNRADADRRVRRRAQSA